MEWALTIVGGVAAVAAGWAAIQADRKNKRGLAYLLAAICLVLLLLAGEYGAQF